MQKTALEYVNSERIDVTLKISLQLASRFCRVSNRKDYT